MKKTEFGEGTRDLANQIPSLEATSITAGGSTAQVVDELCLIDKN